MGDLVSIAYSVLVEACYERATEFIPERWGEKPEMVRDKQVFVPFSVGRSPALNSQTILEFQI